MPNNHAPAPPLPALFSQPNLPLIHAPPPLRYVEAFLLSLLRKVTIAWLWQHVIRLRGCGYMSCVTLLRKVTIKDVEFVINYRWGVLQA